MLSLANDMLRLIVTGKCNLACFYCHNEGQMKEDTFISKEFLARTINALVEATKLINEITISGGEPLMHPDLPEIVSLAAAVSDDVTLVTNGTLLSAVGVHDLARAGLNKLRLGVDSLKPYKPRPSPGLLSEPFDPDMLIASARSEGIDVEMNVVITRFNRHDIGHLAAFALQRRVPVKFFEHVDVVEYGSADQDGQMASQPHVDFDTFHGSLEAAVGQKLLFLPVVGFGQANLSATVGDTCLIYCRYLCPYDLCWVTGTRIDPLGYVYNCMVNRGLDRIDSSMDHSTLADTVGHASARPCRAPHDVSIST